MGVMRDGKVVDTVGTEIGTNGLISLMTGRTITPAGSAWANPKKRRFFG